jgi:hypothetical protein
MKVWRGMMEERRQEAIRTPGEWSLIELLFTASQWK